MYFGNIISLNSQKTLVSMIIDKKKLIITVVILFLVSGNIILGVNYFFTNSELKIAQKQLDVQKVNVKALNFSKLFIEKVLKAKTEVSFDDRLMLENDVRALNDPEILKLWDSFIESRTGDDAQDAVKNLLDALVKKINY